MGDYFWEHIACPVCKSCNVWRTCVGSVSGDGTDRNEAHCEKCNWVGIVHDLTPANEEALEHHG